MGLFKKFFAGKNSFSVFIIRDSSRKYKCSLSGISEKRVDLFWLFRYFLKNTTLF